MERLRKLLRLTWAETLCLGQAWGLLWTLEIALLVIPFQSVLNFLRQVPSSAIRLPLSAETDAPRLAWLIERAALAGPVGGPCLRQTLVLLYMLRRRGQEGQVRIGVAREQGCFKAHAWLDQNGRVLLGQAGFERYTLLYSTNEQCAITSITR